MKIARGLFALTFSTCLFSAIPRETAAHSSLQTSLTFTLVPRSTTYGLGNPVLFDLVVTNVSSSTVSGEMEFTDLNLLAGSPQARQLNCLMPSFLATNGSRHKVAGGPGPAQTPLPLTSSSVNPNYALSGYPYVYADLFTLAGNSTLTISAAADLTCFYKILKPGAYLVQGEVSYYIGNSDVLSASTNPLAIAIATLPSAAPLPPLL